MMTSTMMTNILNAAITATTVFMYSALTIFVSLTRAVFTVMARARAHTVTEQEEFNMKRNQLSAIAIMIKPDRTLGIIALDSFKDKSFVGSRDARCERPPSIQQFPTRNAAIDAFNNALAVSVDRNWRVAHLGHRNTG